MRRVFGVLAAGAVVLAAGCGGEISGSPVVGAEAGTDAFVPSEDNQDPSLAISGIETEDFPPGKHVPSTARVAYDESPPFGGTHDQVWATCTGIVYPTAVRTENMVHSLEHGAVWIAYNPDDISGSDRDALAERVEGMPYLMMSPYPDLDQPISLQSWGHRLKLDDADDPRIDQFIEALRVNEYTTPEVGATCATVVGSFDPDDPPPFDESEPPAGSSPPR
ncbi:DUF3105 domain-containing protein [Antrihabitans sp. YC3-6]|uniref:DUF3105 domain-containing protein n=1 Tax=Antrihabitans stalagmiti TaxID=2799499 RepID=A0A934NNE7_9NOCA|nr:DUF3105 domain-containing protein [Antrihabitans stalagmiti]